MDLIEEYLNAKLISAQTEEELRMIEASVERFIRVLAQNPARMFAALHAMVIPPKFSGICQ